MRPLYSTTIPEIWYQYLKPIADAENVSVHTLVREKIESKLSPDKQRALAVSKSWTLLTLKQHLIQKAWPELPTWEIPPSNPLKPLRTPTKQKRGPVKVYAAHRNGIVLTDKMYSAVERRAQAEGKTVTAMAHKMLRTYLKLKNPPVDSIDDE